MTEYLDLNRSESVDKLQRYYYYIANGVDTLNVAELEQHWIDNILALIPKKLRQLQESIETLSSEMREDYHMSVKKAIGI
jgi:dynein heavy chain